MIDQENQIYTTSSSDEDDYDDELGSSECSLDLDLDDIPGLPRAADDVHVDFRSNRVNQRATKKRHGKKRQMSKRNGLLTDSQFYDMNARAE